MRIDPIILAVSRGFDIIEGEFTGAASGHSGRVASLCVKLGTALGLSEDELVTLSVAALYHDSALTEWIVSGEGSKSHCIMGQKNIDTLPLPSNADGLCLYHHERSDGSGLFGKKEIPIGAEIISLADTVDLHKPLTGFSPALLDAFEKTEKNPGELALPEWHLAPEEVVKLGGIIAKSIDYKSKFTRLHTVEIAKKAVKAARFYEYGPDETAKLYLAAILHDLGKLSTPTEVLEKPGSLTSEEFEIIKNHVLVTHELLEGVDTDIRSWAAGHHEKLDGKGYPFGLSADEQHVNAQLLTCIDIYQAVSEERPYHAGRSHEETIGIMQSIAKNGTINQKIVNELDAMLV